MTIQLLTPTDSYVTRYSQAVEYAEKQVGIFWTPGEIKVEKDKQSILVDMTEAERHGVVTTLKLFTLYELLVGNEYWGDVIAKRFPRPDIQRMANCFAFFELNVHAPFYAKINEVLGLASDEFYTGYVNDPVLKERMDFIDETLEANDNLVELAAFSMIEGAVLYSSFAYLKHFQSQGKNKINNIVRGINFSVRDENLHSEAGAWLFRQFAAELKLTAKELFFYEEQCRTIAEQIYEHECRIIDMIFEKGKIEGITDVQMKHFVQSRLNTVLQQLGFKKLYEVKYNPIAEWFYKGINNFTFNDFFAGLGREYNRNWDEDGFTWVR